MKVRKKTTTTKYSLNTKEISMAVLQFMNLQEDLVDNITFDISPGSLDTKDKGLEMHITVSHDEDISELKEQQNDIPESKTVFT